jgi:LuxR family maltose regulon positive regulatory protein
MTHETPPASEGPGAMQTLRDQRLARMLFSSKLAAPIIRGDAVGRERLLGLLEQSRCAKLTLIQAAAGYGKTTLMAQWSKQLAQAGEAAGWINLDEQDNAPARLLVSLQHVLSAGAPPEDADILELINRSAQRHARFTLFMDEVEALQEPQALRVLELLLDYSPANFHLVLGTRTAPALPLARLRVRGDLVELNSQDLRFTRPEAAQFLYVRCGAQLSKPALEALIDKTEGWPAALQLIALSLARGRGRDSVMEHLSGSQAQVIEFLEADVLDDLPDPVRAFLLRTCVLKRLCAPLCDAVTGNGDGAAMLQRLETENLFLQQLDSARAWYRYHALFAEFLRGQLHKTFPGGAAQAARKAADWCAANGLMVEAVEYSLQAADDENALMLIERYVGEQVGIARFPTIRAWLAALPQHEIERHPRLMIANAWAQTFAQDYAQTEKLLTQLQRVAAQATSPDSLRKTLMVLEPVLLIYTGRLPEAMERAQRAWNELDRDSAFEKGGLSNVLAYGCIAAGRHDDVQRYLREAAACHTGPPANALGLAYVARNAGLAEACLGNLRGAIELFASIGELAAGQGRDGLHAEGDFLRSFASAYAAGLLYERDEIDEAEDALEHHLRFRDSLPSVDVIIIGYIVEARIHLAREERHRAEEVLFVAVQHVARRGMLRLTLAVQWERVRIALVQGDLERARIIARSIEAGGVADAAPVFVLPDQEIDGAGIEQIRLLIHEGNTDQALALLRTYAEHARRALRRRRLIKLQILEALALDEAQQREPARTAMLAALRAAAAIGAVRSFADEGPRCALLVNPLAADREVRADRRLAALVERLNAVFEPGQATVDTVSSTDSEASTQILSARETQILQRLAQGYSNLAVAQQLFVSTNTVKWHLRQIYEKLGAKNRSQAIFAARQRGVLD